GLGDERLHFATRRVLASVSRPGVGIVLSQRDVFVAGGGHQPGVLTGALAAAREVLERSEVLGDFLDLQTGLLSHFTVQSRKEILALLDLARWQLPRSASEVRCGPLQDQELPGVADH